MLCWRKYIMSEHSRVLVFRRWVAWTTLTVPSVSKSGNMIQFFQCQGEYIKCHVLFIAIVLSAFYWIHNSHILISNISSVTYFTDMCSVTGASCLMWGVKASVQPRVTLPLQLSSSGYTMTPSTHHQASCILYRLFNTEHDYKELYCITGT